MEFYQLPTLQGLDLIHVALNMYVGGQGVKENAEERAYSPAPAGPPRILAICPI